MKINRFLSTYLRASDLQGPITVVIDRVELEKFDRDGKEEEKLVLYPSGDYPGIVLGKLQLTQLAEIFESHETDDWPGRRVCMFADPNVMFQGKRVGGIRFKATSQAKKKLPIDSDF